MKKTVSLGKYKLIVTSKDPKIFDSLNSYPDYPYTEDMRIDIKVYFQSIEGDHPYINKSNYIFSKHSVDLDPSIIKGHYVSRKLPASDLILLENIIISRDFVHNKLFILHRKDQEHYLIAESFVETFIAQVIYRNGEIPFHGAVLVKNNSSIAFIGKSNSGKSSTVVQLFEACDGLLCNDFFYLNLKDKKVHSLDKTIGVRKSDLRSINRFIANIQSEDCFLGNKVQDYYDISKFSKLNFYTTQTLSKIIYLEIKEDIVVPSINKISNSQALRYFLENSIHPSKLLPEQLNLIHLYQILSKEVCFFKLCLPRFEALDLGDIDSIFDERFIEEIFGN
ncbi:hypothetical protein NYE24_02965 [Paenibacillus sp. FSL H7-0350]|uniref:hypothetical protein n=1 Tax=Paenibacillus sp. FSL H7-0350 TaxID=2975345 RepID=UPI0031599493